MLNNTDAEQEVGFLKAAKKPSITEEDIAKVDKLLQDNDLTQEKIQSILYAKSRKEYAEEERRKKQEKEEKADKFFENYSLETLENFLAFVLNVEKDGITDEEAVVFENGVSGLTEFINNLFIKLEKIDQELRGRKIKSAAHSKGAVGIEDGDY